MKSLFFPSARLQHFTLLLILLVAGGLRLYRLDAVPPGLTHDEAGHGHDAIAILDGARPIYLTVGYGREPLYDYANAISMSLFGRSALAMRLTSAFAGTLLAACVYLLARRWFGGPVALVAASLVAVSFWPLAVSRQALRSSLLPTLFAGAVMVYWSLYARASAPPSKRTVLSVALFSLLVAATLYTYIPARVLWIVFVVFLVYLAVFHRVGAKRFAALTLSCLIVAGLLAWPMFEYLRRNPAAEARLSMLDAPLQALQRGDLSVVLNEAASAVAGWFVPGRGDDFLAYTIRGRPVFDPITFTLFMLGLCLCFRNFRKPEYAFPLIWLAVGVAPSLLTGNDASMTRSIGAMPAFYILPALGGAWIAHHLRRPRAILVLVSVLVLLTALTSVNDYFSTWGQSPDVRAAYQHSVVEMAVRAAALPEPVVVSSVYPIAPHDPYVAQVTLARDRPPFRWIDARGALIFPPISTNLMIPASTPPDPYWLDLLGQPSERVATQPDDLDPYFDVYRWDSPSAAQHALAGVARLSYNFGGAVELVGVDLRTPHIAASGTVEVAMFWRVIDPARAGPIGGPAQTTDVVLFTHALSADGAIVGQQDRLDAPSWSWQAGDVVGQIHRFALNTDSVSGPVTLEVGLYDRASGVRLPLLVDGRRSGDSAVIATVEVTP